MATSGTTSFDLSIDDIVEEAFERCGMRVTAGHQLNSARRSMNLLFLDWANRGLNLWTIEQGTKSLSASDATVTLDSDTVNILSAVIRTGTGTSQQDVSLQRISRQEYLNLPSKNAQGRPSQFYVERSNTPTAYIYPAADGDYTMVYYRIRRIQDAGTYTNNADVNYRFLPCLVSGLAYHLSMKYAPERVQALKQMYDDDFLRAAVEDRDTASARFIPAVG